MARIGTKDASVVTVDNREIVKCIDTSRIRCVESQHVHGSDCASVLRNCHQHMVNIEVVPVPKSLS